MAVSTQVLALGTFAIHFAVLPLALLPSTPRSYSPNVYFVVAFCALSASLNIMWLKEIFVERDDYRCHPAATCIDEELIFQDVHRPCQKIFHEEWALAHVQERSVKLTYLPFYIVGNILLSVSSFSAREHLYDLSQIFLLSNSVVQTSLLYTLADDARNSVITPPNVLTHLVIKTNMGLTILLIWSTWSILNTTENPSIEQLMTMLPGLLLATISSGPDPILGLSILFILFSLIFSEDVPPIISPAALVTWQFTFRLLAIIVSTCLAIELAISKRNNFPWLSGWKVSSSRVIATPCP